MKSAIYHDNQAVDDVFIDYHDGQLKETIERISTNKGTGGEVGGGAGAPVAGPLLARATAAVNAHYERGNEEEFIYSLDDERAKYGLLIELIQDLQVPEIGDGFTIDERSKLPTDCPIVLNFPIWKMPLEQLRHFGSVVDSMADIQEGLTGMTEMSSAFGELDEEGGFNNQVSADAIRVGAQGFDQSISGLIAEENYHRIKVPGGSKVDFVMKLDEDNYRDRPSEFPRPGVSYFTIAKLTERVPRGPGTNLVSIADVLDQDSDRNDQRQKSQKMKEELAEFANEELDDRYHVQASEFDISFPDVEIKPLIIQ